ncbi:MAG: epimerase [Burkholderiales bacterium PBB3]|nr:MAG: epimerase [Burkholderiales bacterium PBB3]
MPSKRIGVLGASSFAGQRALKQLVAQGYEVIAFSRTQQTGGGEVGVIWHQLPGADAGAEIIPLSPIEEWLCFAPIWILADFLPWLQACGVRRIVAFSSTSRFTKAVGAGSQDPAENALAERLASSEDALAQWAERHSVNWKVLRPTLIYGLDQDRNLSEIARFIRKFGFFPLLGAASGKRQPIHVDDVAAAAVAAIQSSCPGTRAYNISGGEVLTYREMVCRIFLALKKSPRFLHVPLPVFGVGVRCLSVLPRYRHWTVSMAERMNRDQEFAHSEAARDFGFSARLFNFDGN